MKVTAQKIAREAGVSETTVSLVLNGRPTRISEQTKKRVLDVAKKFNYKSNQIAVSLATQRTKTLGLVLPNLTNPLFPRLAAGLEKEAQENGYALFLCNCEEKAELFLDYLETMQRRCIDGLVMLLPSEIDEQRDSYWRHSAHRTYQWFWSSVICRMLPVILSVWIITSAVSWLQNI